MKPYSSVQPTFCNKPVDPIDLVLRVQNALIVKRHHDHLENYAVELEQTVSSQNQANRTDHENKSFIVWPAQLNIGTTKRANTSFGWENTAASSPVNLALEPDYCRQIELASQLHDVGKIGIPDSILLNPGKLDREEFEMMKTHCGLGCEIMEPLANTEMRTH